MMIANMKESEYVERPSAIATIKNSMTLSSVTRKELGLSLNKPIIIITLANIGVNLIMFSAGMETNIKEIKKNGVASIVITALGVIL